MLRRMALARIDISEQSHASIIRVIRIGELGELAVTSNRNRQLDNAKVAPSSLVLVSLTEAIRFCDRLFLQERQGVTS
jgi:hypothetical protein